MAVPLLFFPFAIGLSGCTAEQEVGSGPSVSNLQPYEDLIYESLSREPVPLPTTTPYDPDTRKRGVYLRGFADAWHDMISGFDLHGDRGTPFYQSGELRKVWLAGYEAGRKPAWERWKQEDLRLRKE